MGPHVSEVRILVASCDTVQSNLKKNRPENDGTATRRSSADRRYILMLMQYIIIHPKIAWNDSPGREQFGQIQGLSLWVASRELWTSVDLSACPGPRTPFLPSLKDPRSLDLEPTSSSTPFAPPKSSISALPSAPFVLVALGWQPFQASCTATLVDQPNPQRTRGTRLLELHPPELQRCETLRRTLCGTRRLLTAMNSKCQD